MKLEEILKTAMSVKNMVTDNEGVSSRREFNKWAEKVYISIMNLSVG